MRWLYRWWWDRRALKQLAREVEAEARRWGP